MKLKTMWLMIFCLFISTPTIQHCYDCDTFIKNLESIKNFVESDRYWHVVWGFFLVAGSYGITYDVGRDMAKREAKNQAHQVETKIDALMQGVSDEERILLHDNIAEIKKDLNQFGKDDFF